MHILPLHQRMAEIWTVSQRRYLTKDEQEEMVICLRANASLVWNHILLENMSLLASETNDTDWQHEICRRIEVLEKKPN